MASQMEQSDSTLNQQEEVQQEEIQQVDSHQEQEEIQLEDSHQDSHQEQSDNIVDGSDEPVVEVEPEVVIEPEAVLTEEPVVELQPEVEVPEIENLVFSDLNDVDTKMSGFTPEVRAHVTPILDLAKAAQTDYQIASEKYNNARTELVAFAESLQDYGVDAAPVLEKFQNQQNQISKLNDSVVKTTWSAFQVMHPEYEREQPALKKVFSELVSTMLERFPGDNTIEKLNGAYKYAKYTVGASSTAKARPTPAPVVAKVVAPKEPTNVDSRAQSLVNDGAVSGTQAMVDVADLSWSEIMDRHKHLL